MNIEQTLEKVRQLFTINCSSDGIYQTQIPRVSLIRAASVTEPISLVHDPAVCIVLQGNKELVIGSEVLRYGALEYLVVSVDIPITGKVTVASHDKPYLCFKLDIDTNLISELVLSNDIRTLTKDIKNGVGVSRASESLIDAVLRMLKLLETNNKNNIKVLAPLIEKEILYWLLQGEQATIFHQIAKGDSRLTQISKAVAILKQSFMKKFDLDDLIASTNMSPAVFFRYFKLVTNMTPLQYQKKLRLQEARKLIYMNNVDIATAGYHVGYESPSQFTREYSRFFGLPPSKDVLKLREGSSFQKALL